MVTFLRHSSQNTPVEYVLEYFLFKSDFLMQDTECLVLHLSQVNDTCVKSIFAIPNGSVASIYHYKHAINHLLTRKYTFVNLVLLSII